MKKKIFISLLAFLALFTIVGCGKKSDKKKERSLKEYETAFFIKDGDKYALFNKDGKKITDFEYTYATSMVNGAAIVEKDDKKGVINSKGKMVVPFGKYKSIYQYSGLYKASDENYKQYLLNADGKEIATLDNKELITYISEGNFSLLYDKNKKSYQLLDVDGKTILSFDEVGEDDPTVNTSDGILSLYDGKKNYIIDLVTGKKIIEFASDVHYCVNVVSKDGKTMTLNSCVGSFQSQDKVTYKFIVDGKLYDLKDECERITLLSDKLICIKDYKNYLIDDNQKVGMAIDGAAYTSSGNYAKAHNGSFEGIDFYENDKVVTNVACRSLSSSGYSESGIYLLSTYYSKPCGTESGTYEFYNSKGEKAFDKSFARAKDFDKNSYAIVSEDKTNYYLIDTTGKKVSENYDEIYTRNYYYETRKDGLEGAIDFEGNLVLEAKYKDTWEYNHDDETYLIYNENDTKYTIYSMTKKKEIATFNAKPNFTDNYIYTSKDSKTTYYTYEGKEFYTTK